MKKLFSVLLIAVLLLSLAACQPAGQSGKTIAFVQCHNAGAYETLLANGFTTAAEQLGYTVRFAAPTDETATAQEKLIQSLIQEGVKGIANNANAATGLETVLKEAKEAGIPVVTVNRDTAGSQLLVQPGSQEMMGNSLMDAILELADGEGSFAVLSGNTSFSGVDLWVHSLTQAAQDTRYRQLTWVETKYIRNMDGDVEKMKALLTEIINKYPDLEVICYVGGNDLPLCIQALEEMSSEVRVTGMGQPSQMQNLVGQNKVCPFYFMWDPAAVGKCAAYALEALAGGATMHQDAALATQLGEFALHSGFAAEFYIYAAPPFRFEGLTTDPDY